MYTDIASCTIKGIIKVESRFCRSVGKSESVESLDVQGGYFMWKCAELGTILSLIVTAIPIFGIASNWVRLFHELFSHSDFRFTEVMVMTWFMLKNPVMGTEIWGNFIMIYGNAVSVDMTCKEASKFDMTWTLQMHNMEIYGQIWTRHSRWLVTCCVTTTNSLVAIFFLT